MTSKPNRKNGATTATDRMFLTEPKPSPTIICPSRFSGEPLIAEATTRIIPTAAITIVRIVWKIEAALIPRIFSTMITMVNTDATATPVA